MFTNSKRDHIKLIDFDFAIYLSETHNNDKIIGTVTFVIYFLRKIKKLLY